MRVNRKFRFQEKWEEMPRTDEISSFLIMTDVKRPKN